MTCLTLNRLLGENAVFLYDCFLLIVASSLFQLTFSSFVHVVNLVVAGSKWDIEEMEDIVLIVGIIDQLTITVGNLLWFDPNHLKIVVFKVSKIVIFIIKILDLLIW